MNNSDIELDWEKSFDVELVKNGDRYELSYTENGYQWRTVTFHSKAQLIRVGSLIENFLMTDEEK
jgi:hypothetical protein